MPTVFRVLISLRPGVVAILGGLLLVFGSQLASAADGKVSFNREVRAILSDRCFKCHGPSKQESELRLDSRAGLLRGTDNGPIVVPGSRWSQPAGECSPSRF